MEGKYRKTLDWGCLLRGILKNLWLVLLALVIGAGVANLVRYQMWTETYTSSATYAVMSRSGTSTTMSNMSAANEAATMMSEIIKSEVMENRIRNELGDKASEGSLSAQVVGDTNILVISSTAQTAEVAFRMILLAKDSFDEYFAKVDSSAVLQLISDARIPLTPEYERSAGKYVFLGALAGAAMMVVLLLLLHIRRDTVQTRLGAREQLDAQILVTLPHEKRAPVLSRNNAVSFYFRENLYRLRSRIETAAPAGEEAVVILVTSVAANEGKSTVAANLALALAEKHQGVLLVDADLRNPTLGKMLGNEYVRKTGLGELLQKSQLSAADIAGAVGFRRKTNLMTILEGKAYPGATDLLSSKKMVSLLGALKKTVKYIVLDTPPVGIFPDGSVLSDLADLSLLVVRQDMVSACDINDAVDSLVEGSSNFQGVVLNDMRSSGASEYGYGYGYGYGKRSRGYGYGYGDEPSRKQGEVRRGGENHE